MKRQLRLLLLLFLALPALLPDQALAGSQHTGEILGTHTGERSLTLRIGTPEGKELMVFHVPAKAVIRWERSKERLEFGDLKPGMKVSVSSRREKGRRVADEIVIRRGPRSS